MTALPNHCALATYNISVSSLSCHPCSHGDHDACVGQVLIWPEEDGRPSQALPFQAAPCLCLRSLHVVKPRVNPPKP